MTIPIISVEPQPVLEYSVLIMPPTDRKKLMLYQDGLGKVIQPKRDGLVVVPGKNVDEQMLQLPSDEVMGYAQRLANAGFFELQDRYFPILRDPEALEETLWLTLDGQSRTVECKGKRPEVPEVVSVLAELYSMMERA